MPIQKNTQKKYPVGYKKCPDGYRKDNKINECVLRGPNMLDTVHDMPDMPGQPKYRRMPLKLKQLLIETGKWEEYQTYFKNNNIQIVERKDKTQKKSVEIIPANPVLIIKRKKFTKKIIPEPILIVKKKNTKKNHKEPPEEELIPEPVLEETPEEPIPEPVLEETQENPILEETPEEPIPEPVLEETPEKPILEEPIPVEPLSLNDAIFGKQETLYPTLDDPEFNVKIAKHREFYENKFDGKIVDFKEQEELETHANLLCDASFELMPHQIFVKNFMSFQTPYNSLLLYHSLGTGKTCSAIGISEEMRNYMKKMGINKKIFIIASPNVQDNFRIQLFDESKLKKENGIWTIHSCVGESLLNEINPTNLNTLEKNEIIKQIENLINIRYKFMGYTQFANYMSNIMEVSNVDLTNIQKKNQYKIQKIKKEFNHRLIIIDEVHNIRLTTENENKHNLKTSNLLMEIAKYADGMRLLLLSATPMYNSYEEIIWITNLMNINDKRNTIEIKDIFDNNGNFKKPDEKNKEDGKELLVRKLTGYVSYVRGENPYSFPFRIYPQFAEHNFKERNGYINYPIIQMNKFQIPPDKILKRIPLFLTKINDFQETVYQKTIENIQNLEEAQQNLGLGYTILQKPLEALNIVYPNENTENIAHLVGIEGLSKIMSFKEDKSADKPLRYNYEYKITERIFAPENIYKYSAKISKICEIIQKSEGIILIYSQWIDGGLVPMALALEELGFTRFGVASHTRSLFSKTENLPKSNFKYMMITGEKMFSPNNKADIQYLNRPDNFDGSKIKVALISKAAGEGIDFKNIRQIHILEPWYNMNRIEQIIGRGVRNLSHCDLPFKKRNVEIYLHATILNQTPEEEPADLYIYRLAEHKSIKIGQVTRVLKENAIDCLLNIEQTNFAEEILKLKSANSIVEIETSSSQGVLQKYQMGDKPFTEICDYMDNCNFVCANYTVIDEKDVIQTTYNEDFLVSNQTIIIKRIKDLFRDIPAGKNFFEEQELINSINVVKNYPIEHIFSALSFLIENENQYLIDRYGRLGHLINHGKYYIFKPNEITNSKNSIYEGSRPVDIKHNHIAFEYSANLPEIVSIQAQNSPSIKFTNLLEKIQDNFDKSLLYKILNKKTNNWYENMGVVYKYIMEQFKIDETILQNYIVAHIIEELPNDEKLVLLEGIYSFSWEPKTDFEFYMKTYFDNGMINDNGTIGWSIAFDNKTTKIYVKTNEGIWKEGEIYINNLLQKSNSYKQKFIFELNEINETIGFMSWMKLNNEYKCKIRNLKSTTVNKSGARLDQMSIKDLITHINDILEMQLFTVENVKKIIKSGTGPFAVILEILLRDFHKTRKNGKIWFLTNEQVVINKITSYTRK